MSVKINYKSNSVKKNSENLVLFVDDKINISPLKKQISNVEKRINELENSDETGMVMIDKKPPHY